MDLIYLSSLLLVLSIPLILCLIRYYIIINIKILFINCFVFNRIVLYFISWYLSRKFSIKLKFNRIGFFAIKEILISFPQIGVNIVRMH
jgi:hypothetical protein